MGEDGQPRRRSGSRASWSRAGPQVMKGYWNQPRRDRPGAARRLAVDRRRGRDGRRRLHAHRRPQEGHDPGLGLQRVSQRGGGGGGRSTPASPRWGPSASPTRSRARQSRWWWSRSNQTLTAEELIAFCRDRARRLQGPQARSSSAPSSPRPTWARSSAAPCADRRPPHRCTPSRQTGLGTPPSLSPADGGEGEQAAWCDVASLTSGVPLTPPSPPQTGARANNRDGTRGTCFARRVPLTPPSPPQTGARANRQVPATIAAPSDAPPVAVRMPASKSGSPLRDRSPSPPSAGEREGGVPKPVCRLGVQR